MINAIRLGAAMTALVLSAAAPAQNLDKVQALATLKGTCQRFTMAGRDLSANCNGAVLNTSYTDGRTSFMFTMADGSIVSFYGRDTKAVGGRATMFVEKITVKDGTDASPPTSAAATGRCSYGNAFTGPVAITCSASAMGRTFAARFVSDGRPPAVTRP